MISYEQKIVAARARIKDGLSQEAAAKLIGAGERSIWRFENEGDEEWGKAEGVIYLEVQKEGRAVGWRGLIAAAKENRVDACKELLNRCEGAVVQKTETKAEITMEATYRELQAMTDDELARYKLSVAAALRGGGSAKSGGKGKRTSTK